MTQSVSCTIWPLVDALDLPWLHFSDRHCPTPRKSQNYTSCHPVPAFLTRSAHPLFGVAQIVKYVLQYFRTTAQQTNNCHGSRKSASVGPTLTNHDFWRNISTMLFAKQ